MCIRDRIVVFHDWIEQVQRTMFVRRKMFTCYAGNIDIAGFVAAATAVLDFIGTTVFGYIAVSLLICTHNLPPFFHHIGEFRLLCNNASMSS